MALLTGVLVVSCNSSRADKGTETSEAPTTVAQVEPTRQLRELPVRQAIKIVHPDAPVPASSTFIVGAVAPGASLTCNNEAVRVNSQGFFAHVVQLKPGENSFHLTESPSGIQQEITVKRELPPPPISVDEIKIDSERLQPRHSRAVAVGDVIEFSAHATPDSQMTVQIGKRKINLHSPGSSVQSASALKRKRFPKHFAHSSVNQGLDAAYGKVYQRRPASSADLYVGFYKVQPDDLWKETLAKFNLTHKGKSKSVSCPAKFTTLRQPLIAETMHDDTIVRVGPDAGRSTPLDRGIRMFVDGWQGDQIRCLFAPSHHFWIKRDDLNFDADSNESDQTPNSVARTINVATDDFGTSISIPLTQKLPYQIEQHTKPNELILRIFGVTADTDWITPALGPVNSQVERISCKQSADGIYEVHVPVKGSRQWGFYADYSETTLVLHVKKAPKVSGDANSLQGLSICVDPGHGGKETGAIGCSGIKEATINLAIGMKLKTLLENAGAKVIMTRVDDRDVSLDERVRIAKDEHVDLLLSVHNNSLPDGRDPITEHGTSSYWYHPQSTNLSHAVNTSMVHDLNTPDFGARFQNLALTRPSRMLAMLAEVGFVINPDEYAMLISESGQQTAAEGICKGILDYMHPTPHKH